jgi:hypothetical protein
MQKSRFELSRDSKPETRNAIGLFPYTHLSAQPASDERGNDDQSHYHHRDDGGFFEFRTGGEVQH